MLSTLEAIVLALMEKPWKINTFRALKSDFKFRVYMYVKNKPGPEIIKAIHLNCLGLKGTDISSS